MRGLALALVTTLAFPAFGEKAPWLEMREIRVTFDKSQIKRPAAPLAVTLPARASSSDSDPVQFHSGKAALLGAGAGFTYGWYMKNFRVDPFYLNTAKQESLAPRLLNRYTLGGAAVGAAAVGGIAWIISAFADGIAKATEPAKREYHLPESRFNH